MTFHNVSLNFTVEMINKKTKRNYINSYRYLDLEGKFSGSLSQSPLKNNIVLFVLVLYIWKRYEYFPSLSYYIFGK